MPAIYAGSLNGNSLGVEKNLPVVNAAVVNFGDFVTTVGGRVQAATAGDRITGVVNTSGSVTGNAGGTNTVLVIIDPDALYSVPYSGVGDATMVAKFFTITGGTGAQQALVSSAVLDPIVTPGATASQLTLIEHAPDISASQTTRGLFKISKSSYPRL